MMNQENLNCTVADDSGPSNRFVVWKDSITEGFEVGSGVGEVQHLPRGRSCGGRRCSLGYTPLDPGQCRETPGCPSTSQWWALALRHPGLSKMPWSNQEVFTRVGSEDGLDMQALGTLPSGHTSARNKNQGEWICQPSSYLFGAHHPLQDAMSLEFVAVLSQPCNLNKKDKICIVFYKGQGLCEEFASMEKSSRNQQVISGSARIPISYLQQGTIFYKYALVDTYSQKRACKLEHIPLENFSIPKTFQSRKVPLFRVLKIPKEEIQVGETWTIFEQLHCHFPRTTPSSPSVSKGPSHQMEVKYLESCFFAHTTSWKSLETMERKLDRYKESSSVCLGDPEERKHFEVTCQSADVHVQPSWMDTAPHKVSQGSSIFHLPSSSSFQDQDVLKENACHEMFSSYFPCPDQRQCWNLHPNCH
ncbi:uncharacterized protein LOC136006382 [Lathamus discolor]|uniref:uncharacterized protein LOC136006382 n=1 Tax=Lathamus discolor TaxID=678569 RepID=UPI0032B859AE